MALAPARIGKIGAGWRRSQRSRTAAGAGECRILTWNNILVSDEVLITSVGFGWLGFPLLALELMPTAAVADRWAYWVGRGVTTPLSI